MGKINYSVTKTESKIQYVRIKHIFFTFINVMALLLPSLALATDYYVSPLGSNANLTGSLSSPFKTINYGMSKLKAGDILYVRSGTYNERIYFYGVNGTESNPITLMAFPNESPIIDGTGISLGSGSSLVQITCEYFYFIGFEIRNANITVIYAGGGGVVTTSNSCKISNCKVHDCWGNGITTMGDFSIIEYCNVYNCAMSNSDGIWSPGEIWGASIVIVGKASHPQKKSIIRHCTVYNSWGEGIDPGTSDGQLVEDNIIYDTYSVALYVMNAQNALVQRNLIYMTKTMGDGSQIGIGHWNESWFVGNENNSNTIINNIVYGCRRNFYAYNPLINLVVSNNIFINSTYNNSVQIINNISNLNSIFANNIIIQEDILPCIYTDGTIGITYSHNLYNKTYNVKALGVGDVTGDPNLAKTGETGAGKLTAEYFKLLSSSPAINKGVIVNTVTTDFFGNLRGASPDIGPHEYFAIDPTIKVTGITVTGAGGLSTITSDNGTLQLTAAITPADATNKTVTWSIANGTGQAIISSSGLVTAIANGIVTAKATANDGSGIFGTLVITISNQIIHITGITVSGAGGATMIITGATLQLSAAVLPSNASNKTVTWSVTNGTGQASINSSGLVTSISPGTITARALANDGSGVSGSLVLTIANEIFSVTDITVTGAGGITTIDVENGTLPLIASLSPSNVTDNTVTWSLENGTGEAGINSAGLVTAISNGIVTAKATANDGSGVFGTLEITISIPEPNIPPVVEIINPINGKHVLAPATVDINVDSYDPDGTISKVEYFINSVKIGESLTEPYTIPFSFESTDTGRFEIVAVATDDLNAVTASSPVIVHVAESFDNSDLISLFPNPNDGHFYIDLLTFLKAKRNAVTIVDLTGKIVYSVFITNEENDMQFDLSYINPGMYILLITGNEIITAKKFIKF